MKKTFKVITLFLSLVLFINQAQAVTFIVNDEKKRDNVSFTSDAPIELIVGRTPEIKGEVVIDDSLDLSKTPPSVSFEVDLSSIDTGIPLRNEHMRDNFLETTKYPKAVFKISKIISSGSPKLINSKKKKLLAKGELTIHGETIKKDIPVTITYLKSSPDTQARFPKGDVIRIQSTFEVSLDDHKIKKPQAVFKKLASKILVTVDAFANEKT